MQFYIIGKFIQINNTKKDCSSLIIRKEQDIPCLNTQYSFIYIYMSKTKMVR